MKGSTGPLALVFMLLSAGGMCPRVAAEEFARSTLTPLETLDAFDHPVIAQAFQYWRTGRYAETAALMRPLAEQGNAAAQFLMGKLHASGEGVPLSNEEAVRWWLKSAQQGLAIAQNELAVALADGSGVETDLEQAVHWYRRAADQGLAVAQVNLGIMYFNGLGGLRTSEPVAVDWFRKAAEQDFAWAQMYLGIAYNEGRGVTRNWTKAVHWFRKAADQDYTEAKYALAVMYHRGTGVQHSNQDAVLWFARAAQDGHESAQLYLSEIVPRLSRIRLPPMTAIRELPDAVSSVIRTANGSEYAYVLSRQKEWVQLYFEDGYIVGNVRTADLRTN